MGTGSYSSFQYNPTGGPWVFTGSAGLSGNASGFASANAAAPEGNQVAFIQGTGSISQAVAALPAGNYQVSFSAAQRASNSSRTTGQNLSRTS